MAKEHAPKRMRSILGEVTGVGVLAGCVLTLPISHLIGRIIAQKQRC